MTLLLPTRRIFMTFTGLRVSDRYIPVYPEQIVVPAWENHNRRSAGARHRTAFLGKAASHGVDPSGAEWPVAGALPRPEREAAIPHLPDEDGGATLPRTHGSGPAARRVDRSVARTGH